MTNFHYMFLSKSKATLVLVKNTSTKLGIHRSSEIEMFALSKKTPKIMMKLKLLRAIKKKPTTRLVFFQITKTQVLQRQTFEIPKTALLIRGGFRGVLISHELLLNSSSN